MLITCVNGFIRHWRRANKFLVWGLQEALSLLLGGIYDRCLLRLVAYAEIWVSTSFVLSTYNIIHRLEDGEKGLIALREKRKK